MDLGCDLQGLHVSVFCSGRVLVTESNHSKGLIIHCLEILLKLFVLGGGGLLTWISSDWLENTKSQEFLVQIKDEVIIDTMVKLNVLFWGGH